MRSCVNAVFDSAGSARIFAGAGRSGSMQRANLLTFRSYSFPRIRQDLSGLTELLRISSRIRATLICSLLLHRQRRVPHNPVRNLKR